MQQQFTIRSLDEVEEVAKAFLSTTSPYTVFAFYAPMGCGKTTFITALCRALGISEVVNSPTFAIVNRYSIPHSKEAVYHMDCYRLEKVEEAINLGFDDYFTSGDRCFIEWPEVIEPLLPEDTLRVYLHENEDHTRTLSFEEP